MTHKWNTPHDWLNDKIRDTDDVTTLRCYGYALLRQLDGDQIQDLFGSEMDEDGYFDRQGLVRCPLGDTEDCRLVVFGQEEADACEHREPHAQFSGCTVYATGCPPCIPVEEDN